MDTEVYFLCPVCNGLTNGTGSGDPDDEIFCNKCRQGFSARYIGKLHPYTGKEANDLRLYVEKSKSAMLIEEA